MNDLYQDIKRYPKIWRSIFVDVLNLPDSTWAKWMQDYGEELISDPGMTLHEEPWFWLCPAVVSTLADTSRKINFRLSENQVFAVLARVYSAPVNDAMDFNMIRSQCKKAIVYESPVLSKNSDEPSGQ